MMQLSEIRAVFFITTALLGMSLFGCSKATTVGKKTHEFGRKAEQIIWIQVAGLTDEHLGLIKFNKPIENSVTPLENALCMGKIWSYNLYDLRVGPDSGFMSQMTGSKNIKNDCSDYDRKFVWNHLQPFKFQSAILEGPTDSNMSLLKSLNCQKGKEQLADSTLWLMRKGDEKNTLGTFHYQKQEVLTPGVFVDRSCQGKGCFASLSNNAKELWKRMRQEPGRKLLVIRDFSYYDSLKKDKNVLLAREKLNELMDLYEYFRVDTKKNNKTLILLSSSASVPFEYPKSGKQWNLFLKKGKNVLYKKTALLSSVWADGPGAENFCSYMDESAILERILWAPEEGVLGIFKL